METRELLKQKIASASDLLSIVRTMKVHASASIRQFERAAQAIGEYNTTVETGFRYLINNKPSGLVSTLSSDSGARVLIVVGSDQGMCGSFNEQLVTQLRERFAADGADAITARIIAVGARLGPLLEEAEITQEGAFTLPSSTAGITALVHKMVSKVEDLRRSGKVQKVGVAFNRRTGPATMSPEFRWFLPIDKSFLDRYVERPWRGGSLPAYRAGWQELFVHTTRQHIFVTLYRALAESLQSEHASRLASMQRAERNIEELLDDLVRRRNQLRQDGITAELLDIVSGYEALSGEKEQER